jgi:hypothetical protein
MDQQTFSNVSGLINSNGKILATSSKRLLKKQDNGQPISGPTSVNTLTLRLDDHMTVIDAG